MTRMTRMTREEVRASLDLALRPVLKEEAAGWLADARRRIAADPDAAGTLLPAAGRRCGRGTLDGEWTVDDAARVTMLLELPGDGLAERLIDLYQYGDAHERRAVLRALAAFGPELGRDAVPLLNDALRSNDPRLVAAALGPYAAAELPAPAWRQAVLKCVFIGVPLAVVAGLDERADAELSRMMADYARERTAAGRDVPPDVRRFLARDQDEQEVR